MFSLMPYMASLNIMSTGTIIGIAIYILYGLSVAVDINCPPKTDVRNSRIKSDLDNSGDVIMYILFLPIIFLHGMFFKKRK